MNSASPPATTGLGLSMLLGGVFLLLSLVILIGDAQSPAFDMHFISSVLEAPAWKTRLFWNVVLFGLALTSLHLAMGIAAWLLGSCSRRAYPSAGAGQKTWTVLWFAIGALWVLCANGYHYPHSALGSVHAGFARAAVGGVSVFHFATWTASTFLAVTLSLALWRWSARGCVAAAGLALAAAGATHFVQRADEASHGRTNRPNVVFIGIDALRNDLFDRDDVDAIAPHLAGFLAGSARFVDTITPLARTFPSWVSIISGKAPRTSGAMVNLLPRDQVQEGITLPRALRKAGYASLYAIDEVRFSNLDASYGFDNAVSPPIGASEFLIAWFADTPLSNLTVNSAVGRWLFPHVHANRAAAAVYDPDVFVGRVRSNLPEDRPLLLAVHLTLAHWPFAWADSPGTHRILTGETGDYLAAVKRVDRQFADLMDALRERRVLENSLVFVFSDHGEALGHPGDLLDVGPLASQIVEEHHAWGHGSSVLSPAQFRVVLGIRDYRKEGRIVRPGLIDAPASLEDLTPTAIDLVGADAPAGEFDGLSLAGLLRGDSGAREAFAGRVRFTETEFNPQGVSTRQIARDALEKAGSLYRVDPTTDRVTVRRALLDQVAESRQHAAIGPAGTLAVLPLLDGQGHRSVFLDSDSGGKPTTVQPAERQVHIDRLSRSLQDHYGIVVPPPGSRRIDPALKPGVPRNVTK